MSRVRVQAVFKGHVIEHHGNGFTSQSVQAHPHLPENRLDPQDDSIMYVMLIRSQRREWPVLGRFTHIRHFRNDLLKKMSKNTMDDGCACMGDEEKQVLEYGFPERKLFGSKTSRAELMVSTVKLSLKKAKPKEWLFD